MSSVLRKLGESEQGFSMAEVVIAMVVFVTAILGITSMLMSGGGAVTRGAMENTATQLAQKKIEDVKSLSFYSPWTGANQDIDDFYWNFDATGTDKNATQLTTPQPEANSLAHEDYGEIPVFGSYRRTTAIQYQTVTPTAMVPATMNNNWVPKNTEGNSVVSPQFDMQKDTTNSKVRLMIVEVKVYYHIGGSAQEKTFTAHAVVSDLMVTGGANNPLLVIKEISPVEGNLNDTDFEMNITVQSDGLTSSDTMSVALWYEGQVNNPATSVTVVSPTLIHCHFNLRDHGSSPVITVRPGLYHLEVYWQNKGWRDTSFRNCFTVVVAEPVFDTLSGHKWGHSGQSARPVVLDGYGFDGATVSLTRTGFPSIAGVITENLSPGSTQIKCTFPLTSISGTDQIWDIAITTPGGTVSSDASTPEKRFLVNPKPVVTKVSDIDAGNSTYNWGHSGMTARKVKFEGFYLYGFDGPSTRTLDYNDLYHTSAGTFVSGGTGDDCGDDVGGGTTATLVVQYNLTTPVGATWVTPDTRWTPTLANYGGTASITTDTQRFYMNPTPVITSIDTSIVNCYSWVHSGQTARNVSIQGNYLYGFNGNTNIKGYEASPTGFEAYLTHDSSHHTTVNGSGIVPCVSGPTGNEASALGQSVTFTLNPSSASGVGYAIMDQYWDTYLRNYGGLVHSTGSENSGGQVYFNPTPVISGIAPTVVDSYYNWGHSGETDRNIMITGSYLYGFNDTSAIAKLWYGGTFASPTYVTTRNSGGSGTYIVSQATVNIEAGTEPVEFNFSPNSAGAGFNTPNKMWNVHLYNFGGAVDSTTDTMRVTMNPTPIIDSVSASGSSDGFNYYDWAYKALPTRNVRINGKCLYALGEPGGTEKSLTHGAYNTATLATQKKGAGDAYALGDTCYTIQSFVPNSIAGTPPGNVRYNVHLKNYGGVVDSDLYYSDASKTVYMNPPIEVSNITGLTTGYRKSPDIKTITVTGKYFRGPWDGIPGNAPMVWLENSDRSIDLNLDNCTSYAADGSSFTLTQTYAVNKFHTGPRGCDTPDQVAGTDTRLASQTAYTAEVECRVDDNASIATAYGCTITHAPIAITGVTAVYYNDWDVPMTVTGDYFDTSNTTATYYDTYGFTGTKTLGGSYGTGQTVTAQYANTIDLGTTARTITVNDTENGKSATYDFSCSTPPGNAVSVMDPCYDPGGWGQRGPIVNTSGLSGCNIDETWGTRNYCQDDATRTYTIVAKRLRDSGLKVEGKIWRATYWSYHSGDGTISKNRANKVAKVVVGIGWPNVLSYDRDASFHISNDSGSSYGPWAADDRLRINN